MGILAPLFLAGLGALSLPLLFHLVRRTPRGRQEFSSLMFLSPTPPRLTRRSRLDQILLLLLRLAALVLLALAFARPFLRESALLSDADLPQRRVAILLDTSASMRRGDLWQQAIAQAERELADLAPHDDVALFAFDDHLRTIVPFNTQTRSVSEVPEVIRSQLASLQPGWGASDLGGALTLLASELASASDVEQAQGEPRIIAIGDFQKGSRLAALQAFEWPEKVRVVARQLKPKLTTNVSARLLTTADDAPEAELRVRVVNAADSTNDQFFVHWDRRAGILPASPENATAGKMPALQETAIYVPPGQSRVLRLPRPASNLTADRIILRGDDHEFDNTFYVVPPHKQEIQLLYLGDDAADDPEGLRYYLGLATSGDPLREVKIESASGEGEFPREPKLAVATTLLDPALQARLIAFIERGGTLLLVPQHGKAATSLSLLFPGLTLPESEPAAEGDFALLGEIDFTHPLFVPFAGPRYNDFTKIHFWRHRRVEVPDTAAKVVARFDNGDPWLLERPVGKGRILALTSSWQPDDSQLALSSKFVPFIGALLDLAHGNTKPLGSVEVGRSHASSPNELERRSTASSYDSPGIYHSGDQSVAVNLAASESDTAPLDLEQLEQLGLRFGDTQTRAERLSHIRQQRDTELESRQQVWRWLIVGCLLLLIVETLVAGRAARPKPVEALA